MRRLALLSILLLAVRAPAQSVWEKTLAPGLVYREEVDRAAPRIVHALRITPGSPLRLGIEPTGGAVNEAASAPTGRATVGATALRAGVLAATNGDYFVDLAQGWNGHSLGLMVRGGELVAAPNPKRSVFAWGSETLAFGKAEWEGSVGALRLSGLNRAAGANEAVLNLPVAGQAVGGEGATFVTLKLDGPLPPTGRIVGTVQAVAVGSGNRPVAPGTAVLVVRGTKVAGLKGLRTGDAVGIAMRTTGFDWAKADAAVGGGPMLVQDGEVAVGEEGFPPQSFVAARHPRTAVGRTAEGDVWLVAVDGRSPLSVGANLPELASIMRRLGCVEAMNLDGGGSTALAALGLTLNRPSDGAERAVANALVVRGEPPAPALGPLSLMVGASVMEGDDVRVVDAQGRAVPNARVLWSASGSVWIDQGGRLRVLSAGPGIVRAAVDGQVLTAKVAARK